MARGTLRRAQHGTSSRAGKSVVGAGGWDRADILVLLVLGLVTFVAFVPSVRCGFTSDDDAVIVQQPHVRGGLTAANIAWSLGAFELGYPIPVTLWSFMLDARIFGLKASWFHAENVMWHVADVALLYLLLLRLTGSRWRSAVVTVLFAVHPLRVESVTWVIERKDVLAAFFGLLAMHAYVGYARTGGVLRYLGVLIFFATSLLAKPMLTMLPVVMMALDFWPLGRLGREVSWRKLLLEKAPLALLSFGVSLAGVAGPAPRNLPVARLPLSALAANAIVSYVRYVGKMLWPRHLSIVYPIVPRWPVWAIVGSVVILLTVSALAWREAGRRPWLLVGWVWYVAILLPATGLHVLGDFSMADRYTYFPMIGLLVMAAWSVPARWAQAPLRIPALCAIACLVVALAAGTWRQTGVWRDNITLFGRAVENSGPSYIACSHLAVAYSAAGRFPEARHAYEDALRCDPDNPDLLAELALACDRAGDRDAAITAYIRAANVRPNDTVLRYNLGTELVAAGRAAEALPHLQRAVELSPSSTQYRNNYATALLRCGQIERAVSQCRQALETDPSAGGVRRTLASALARRGDFDGAEQQYELAILNDPRSAASYNELGALSLARKRVDFAITCFRRAIELAPELADAHANLGVAYAMQNRLGDAEGEFSRALEIDPQNRDAAENLKRLRDEARR
jgi:protein O-mannosyl-transferase